MKKLLLLFALIFAAAAQAQQDTAAPDYAAIEQHITNPDSEFYYPALLQRYQDADITLTAADLQHLYYGSIYVQRPVSTAQAMEALKQFNALASQPSPTRADLEAALGYTDVLLKFKPYSILLKQYRVFCLKELGRTDEALKERAQYEMIAETILASGTGTSAENSIHVTDVDNESEILELLRYKQQGEPQTPKPETDYIPVANNVYGVKGIYFYIPQPKRELSVVQ